MMKNMKVTVRFGNIRVVVPCGDGEMLVQDLIREAIRRFKNASGKSQNSWIVVHHLQSQSGILDPDDKLNDVADDREQIIASFDEYSGLDTDIHQGGGDGASGSSAGTGSPDVFRKSNNSRQYEARNDSTQDSTHIEVNSNSDHSGLALGLQVRRGSEPNLNQLNEDSMKRWSAAPVCRNDSDPPERIFANMYADNNTRTRINYEIVPEEDTANQNESMKSNFSRSGRLSMQFSGDGVGQNWMDAADRVAGHPQSVGYSFKSLPRESKRKEPLGQANTKREKEGEMLLIVNEDGSSLGLTAIPDPSGAGLIVQDVAPNSSAERGRLRSGDRIVEVNGMLLEMLGPGNVEMQLRKYLLAPELRLRVIRGSVMNKRNNRISQLIDGKDEKKGRKVVGGPATAPLLQMANTRKLGRRIEIELTKGPHGLGFSITTRDNPTGGHCPIYIKSILQKGAAVEDGRLKPGDRLLEVDGVTMTGKSQTDVVGILRSTPPGAVVKLLISRLEAAEVEEARSRNEEATVEPANNVPSKPPAPVLPAKILKSPTEWKPASFRLKGSGKQAPESPEKFSQDTSDFPWRNREILTLHIPCHDTEKAGLGVSVKGKTGSPMNGSKVLKHDGDLGIFVKSVIHGGAASRDGRLKMNDQLLSVNGASLLGQSNAEAMNTLRRAMMHNGGQYPGNITLTVARKISRPASVGEILDLEGYNSKAALETSGEQKDESQMRQRQWNNPILERLTGNNISQKSLELKNPALHHKNMRNESYYMATLDNWSPAVYPQENNSVLIEEDPELSASNIYKPVKAPAKMSTSTPSGDVTYASQLSIESNPPIDAFSRDAIGRRSMSEKHHAALDAKETGTYQRNKKLREEREREKSIDKGGFSGSMESVVGAKPVHKHESSITMEALDRLGELGPSLGMKKSSSLESLQTMVQEIQMSEDHRRPNALKTPRGRGREELVRAAVEADETTKTHSRKHWLLENDRDFDGGFAKDQSPLKSYQATTEKSKKKSGSILKGIGHMFRFGKHRKDAVTPVVSAMPVKARALLEPETLGTSTLPNTSHHSANHVKQRSLATEKDALRIHGPPQYVDPPKPNSSLAALPFGVPTAIHQSDVFNHRYSHYVNFDELQSRHHHVYRSTRSTRELPSSHQYHPEQVSLTIGHYQQRPQSMLNEYETSFHPQSSLRKPRAPLPTQSSSKNRGPFITQVTIRSPVEGLKNSNPSASKV